MEIVHLQAALATCFAPWVQALGLTVEQADDAGVLVRLPLQSYLAREGGMVCGQAMMAAADTCMVLAGQDGLILAKLIRVGKSLAFGEIDICGASDRRSVCRATTTYALL